MPGTFVGVIASAQGAGSIAGGLFAGRLIARRGSVTAAAVGSVIFAAGCLMRCLPWPALVVASGVLVGVGLPWTLIAGVTAVQRHTPAALLGRVLATSNTAMFGPIALAIPLGSLAVRLGSIAPFLAAAAACTGTALLTLRARRHPDSGDGEVAPSKA